MAHSALPYDRLLSIDERLRHAAARPVIAPDTIVIDHGSVFVSANFRSSCRHLGISIRTRPGHRIGQAAHREDVLHARHPVLPVRRRLPGGSAAGAGARVEAQPLWSLMQMQDLLDEWLISVWQNRQHDGLRDPAHPGRAFTPNEKYAALAETAGYVPVALSAGDYIELLPAIWRAINAYGVKISYRTYDDEALNPLRLQRSGVKDRRDLWEIHYDPCDVTRIWVRDHGGAAGSPCPGSSCTALPRRSVSWRGITLAGGRPGASEEELAAAVAACWNGQITGPPRAAVKTPPRS